MPFFSIIIPVYNVEAYLERCLQSILEDQCKDLEIILVDDGSTDSSGDICEQFACRYKNIKVIRKPNGGLSSARNAGMDEAVGEWISFVDSDDWVDKDSYQLMKSILSKTESSIDLVKIGYKKVSEDRTVDFIPCVDPGRYDVKGIRKKLIPLAMGNKLISNSTNNTFILSTCAHLYRRQFLEATGMRFVSEREVGSEDFLFLYSLYMRASAILVTDLRWYNYYTRDGSLTQRYRKKLFIQYRRLGKAIYEQLIENGLYVEYKEIFSGLYISLMYICIMNECSDSSRKIQQMRHVRKILKSKTLKHCLDDYNTRDWKSLLISRMMKYEIAFPLCMIQWRKAKNK